MSNDVALCPCTCVWGGGAYGDVGDSFRDGEGAFLVEARKKNGEEVGSLARRGGVAEKRGKRLENDE